MRRIGVLGCGTIGSGVIASLREADVCDIVVWNRSVDRAQSILFDVDSAMPGPRRSMLTLVAEPRDIGKVDLLLVLAGKTIGAGQSRADVLVDNGLVLRDVLQGVRPPGSGVFVVTNPVEAMCGLVAVLLGLPEARVVGLGGDVDVGRARASAFGIGERHDLEYWGLHGAGDLLVDGHLHREAVSTMTIAVEKLLELGPPRFGPALQVARRVRMLLRGEQGEGHASLYSGELGVHLCQPAMFRSRWVSRKYDSLPPAVHDAVKSRVRLVAEQRRLLGCMAVR